jgi:D-mannonate dehydratase
MDDIRLDEVRQTGVAGIVTTLHEIAYGEVGPVEAICLGLSLEFDGEPAGS